MRLQLLAQRHFDLALAILMSLGLIIVSLVIYIFNDWRRHRRPLKEADPNANYSVIHHVRMVTIPLLKYRLNVKFERNNHHIKRF